MTDFPHRPLLMPADESTERDDEPRKAVYPTSQPGPTPDDVLDTDDASDGPCDDCGRRYPPWWAPHALWNLTLGGPDARDDPGGMLCPTCFLLRAPKGIWYLSPSEGASVIAEARREGAAEALDEAAEALGKEAVGFRNWWQRPGGGPEDGAALDTVKQSCDWLKARAVTLRGDGMEVDADLTEARREAMIDFATWLSEQDELDVFTADEAVDQFLRSDA